VTVWVEPQAPRHPLIGLMHALDLAEGRPVLACPLDLPFVTADLVRRLAREDPGGAPAVVARAGAVVQPLLGCYQPEARERLRSSGFGPDVPARRAVAAIGAREVEVESHVLFNVNSPDDLLQAAAMLDRARPPRGVPSADLP
jgi:molybdopterin-guanine dinucleotide biosynthesis protein A